MVKKTTKKTVKKNRNIKVKQGKHKKSEKIASIIGLALYAILIVVLLYALITMNGNLAMAMIFSLVFVSILLFIALKLYK